MGKHSTTRGPVAEAFGRVLRVLRREEGLSQEELAESASLHRTYISLLERGLKSPSLDTLFRLCRSLGVAPQEVVSRVNAQVARVPGSKRG